VKAAQPASVPVPTVAALAHSVAVFNGFANVDGAERRFATDTAPRTDLDRADHRAALLRFLNAWGCRIRLPRPGEPDWFDVGIATWWAVFARALPRAPIDRLSDGAIRRLEAPFDALATTRVAPNRTLGSTAAAKALYALRPRSVVPWDAAIAATLHGARDGAAFGRHLALGRAWANAVLSELSQPGRTVTAARAPALLGRGGVSLAKILDEYAFVTITMGH
jgi:hypothetical protein